MKSDTISGIIKHTVILGGGTYSASVNVIALGGIDPGAPAPGGVYDGLTADVTNAAVANRGSISGSSGYGATLQHEIAAPSNGGTGVDLTTASDTVLNFNVIAGGNGGAGFYLNAGYGGVGIVLAADGVLNNSGGTITGGNGGDILSGSSLFALHSDAGGGGAGVVLSSSSAISTNSGTLQGGAGGNVLDPSYGVAGAGGAGLELTAASFTNDGHISGGYAGTAASLTFIHTGSAPSSSGGQGAQLRAGATLTNNGDIAGGAGNGTRRFVGYVGGTGGSGVDIASGAVLNNAASITGGYGGLGVSIDGAAGAGVYLHAGGTLNETAGSIMGGNGAASPPLVAPGVSLAGAGGTGVQMAAGATLHVYGGTIAGGIGGYSLPGIYGGDTGGSGGAGVTLAQGATLRSVISITGGAGGYAGLSQSVRPSQGGVGGAGAYVNDASLVTDGVITGGAGGATATGAGGINVAGIGGVGVLLEGGTLTNSGAITGGAGGTDNSYGTGGTGGAGVYVNGGTLITAGTITGGGGGAAYIGLFAGAAGDAVRFGSLAGTLVVDPGATFNGQVAGNHADVLALGGTALSTLSGFGTQFTGFGELQFQSGARWTVDTTASGLESNTPSVTGFAAGDTLDVKDVKLSGVTESFAGGVLTLEDSGTKLAGIDFDNPAGTNFLLTPDAGGNGFDVTLGAACYRRGTRILTLQGEVPIEKLCVGDEVITMSGARRAIRWLGHRRIDCRRHPHPTQVWPIRIRAGALEPNTPRRDLWLSPGHSLYLEGVLIQAENLINGATIEQVPHALVEYWHVELDEHEILLAEGAPSESYLDTGNRTAFSNGGAFIQAHPNFMPKHWSATCVPLVREGERLMRARARLQDRAQSADLFVHFPVVFRR